MKKIAVLFVITAALGLTACGDPEPERLPGGEPVEQECREGTECP